MANKIGAIHVSIWKDPDFIARTANAQRLYLALFSQEDLTLCGVIPLRLNRWAKLATDTTAATVTRALAELEQHRFLVVDRDAEEVLVRTYVRHGGSLKLPNVIVGMSRQYAEIRSAAIRYAIIRELPPTALDIVRGTVRQQLREPFLTDFAEAKGIPSPNPSGNPSEDPFTEPIGEPIPEEMPILPYRPNALLPLVVDISPPQTCVAATGTGTAGAAPANGGGASHSTTWPAVVHAAIATLAIRELAEQPPGTVKSEHGWLRSKRDDLLKAHGPALLGLAGVSGIEDPGPLLDAWHRQLDHARALDAALTLARNHATAVDPADFATHPLIATAPPDIRAAAITEHARLHPATEPQAASA